MAATKLWGGRFDGEEGGKDPLAEAFNASIAVDQALLSEDIQGSIAHCKMLFKIGILTSEEQQSIENGLLAVKKDFMEHPENFSLEQEDIHMNVEYQLTLKIGEVAKKLHTARSRNDQVAVDFRLYTMKQNLALKQALLQLISVLVELAEVHSEDIMPGYTHLQRAQPVTLGFHLLTYVEMFRRDVERLEEQYPRISRLPLGSGALAGLPYPTDREFLKNELNFEAIATHAMDAVSDRDFAIEFLSSGAMIQMHLSRLAEELILWSTSEFQFIKLSDAYCTGSSIMPQKRNPDVSELIRGKTGRIYGNLMGLLTTLKALPLAYNKDLQEDKLPVIDTAEQLNIALTLMARMLQTAKFNTEKMLAAVKEGFLNATDLADYLVGLGIPFRTAHEISGKAVKLAESTGADLETLTLAAYQEILEKVTQSTAIQLDTALFDAINPWNSVNQKLSPGSTAVSQVKKMVLGHQQWLNNQALQQ